MFRLSCFLFLCFGHVLCLAKTWIWQGALMPNSITFKVKSDEEDFRLVAATADHRNLSFTRIVPQSVLVFNESDLVAGGWKVNSTKAFQLFLEGLEPNTNYTWSSSGNLEGRFATPPQIGTAFNFSFSFASCADNDSNHDIFTTIPDNQHPLFFIHTGDLNYGNLHRDSFLDYSEMFDRTLLQPNQGYLFRNLPVVYMWDDHDYGPNNADKSNPGRNAAMKAYRSFAPSYPLGTKTKDGPIFQHFVIGRVFFIVTDTSSERIAENRTTLGYEQLSWFEEKLEQIERHSQKYLAVVWVSTMPWIDDHYKWGEFPEERMKIGSLIRKYNLSERLIIVSGDAHMLAVDDGTHSVGGVKVFQAAALDAKPTTKGGPYSHGVWPGRNQYGSMSVLDMGSKICFTFRGWRYLQSTKSLRQIVLFDSCNSSLNKPNLYRPSPFFIQKGWKTMKRYLEQSDVGLARRFVLYIDSSSVTFYSIGPAYAFSFLALIATTGLIAVSAIFD